MIPGDGWIELFPDQDWNDFPAESVLTFRGILIYQEADTLPSYVMRFNPYRLEMEEQVMEIYMGSSDVLHPLVGEDIEIRGMVLTICVEGHLFVEIWPTEYRPAQL